MKILGGPDYNSALYEAALSGLVEQTAGEWNCEAGICAASAVVNIVRPES